MADLDQAQIARDLAVDDIHKHVVHTPYTEYPRHVHGKDGAFRVVTNDAERSRAMAEGYTLTPQAQSPAVPAASDASPKAAKK